MLAPTVDAQALVKAVSNARPRPVVAIFAEPLLAPSMTFVRAQASALIEFAALYISPQRAVPSLEIPPDQAVVLQNNRHKPRFWNRLQQVPFKIFGYDRRFFQRVAAHRPVLLHAHFGTAGLTALPLARWLNVPLVVSFHGFDATVSDAFLARSNYRARIYSRKRYILQKEGAMFIAASEFLRKQMIEQKFPAERVVVHYVGVDTDFFQPAPGVPREPLVLFTGRLTEQKGCEYLIRAMRDVQAVRPEAELVVIGDGDLRSELERLARDNLGRYRFLGWQNPETVRHWMNRAWVFSGPSIRVPSGATEGFGLVFAEAQAMGLPVISFASGGIPEAVAHGETGLLSEERDWRMLARNILLLLGDETLRTNMSMAGRQRIRSLFDLRSQTKLLEDLYLRVLSCPDHTVQVRTGK
jgi:colanic acid/amylovoran biosynthesis glycosyltransferase